MISESSRGKKANAAKPALRKEVGEERARAVHGAMEKLPEEYREAVYLKYFEGLSPEEIARVTGRRIKRVYNLLARGRAAMKEILTAEGIRNDE